MSALDVVSRGLVTLGNSGLSMRFVLHFTSQDIIPHSDTRMNFMFDTARGALHMAPSRALEATCPDVERPLVPTQADHMLQGLAFTHPDVVGHSVRREPTACPDMDHHMSHLDCWASHMSRLGSIPCPIMD